MFLIKHALIHMVRACYILVLTTHCYKDQFFIFLKVRLLKIYKLYTANLRCFKEIFLQFLANAYILQKG